MKKCKNFTVLLLLNFAIVCEGWASDKQLYLEKERGDLHFSRFIVIAIVYSL